MNDSRRMAPHQATVLLSRSPHPATVGRQSSPPPASLVLPKLRGPVAAKALAPHPATVPLPRRAPGPASIQRMIQVTPAEDAAKKAVAYVKGVIRWGAGNVRDSILASEGRSVSAFEQSKAIRNAKAWRYFFRDIQLGTVEKIFARAAIAIKAEGGNCEEHADLTFVWLFENTSGLTLNYACGDDHAYVIIGNPGNQSTWLVVDPWPHKARTGGHDVACQAWRKWEVSGILTGDQSQQTTYNGVCDRSFDLLDAPQIEPANLPALGNYKELAKRAYNVG